LHLRSAVRRRRKRAQLISHAYAASRRRCPSICADIVRDFFGTDGRAAAASATATFHEQDE
jgi:hypothetical protein